MPAPVRERAISGQHAVAVGPQFAESADLRPALREAGLKDAIVVPLRSGQATIGSVEVVNRLGGQLTFRTADVQVLETIAAHAAVAVENSRLVERLPVTRRQRDGDGDRSDVEAARRPVRLGAADD